MFRITNIVLIYALFLDITVPFAQTMDKLLATGETYSEHLLILPSVPDDAAENIAVSTHETKVLAVSEAEKQNIRMTLAGVSSSGAGGSGGISINAPDNLVDPFSGDFTYSIPLMDVEGYPINLSYNSNVTMNTEASWVGLGWNLDVGSVDREMRGIPDEFNGTQNVVREVNQLDDVTLLGRKSGRYWSGGLNVNIYNYVNLDGMYNSSKLRGSYYNSYLGAGRTFDKTTGWNVGIGATIYFIGLKLSGNWGKNYNYDSKRGLNIGQGGGLTGGVSVFGIGADVSTYSNKNFNSREGMTGKSITRGWGWDVGPIVSGSYSRTSTVMYGSQTQVPRIQLNSWTTSYSHTKDRFMSLAYSMLSVGLNLAFGKLDQRYSSVRTELKNGNKVLQPAIGFLHSSKKIPASDYTLPIMDFNRSNDTRYSDEMTNLPFSMQTFDIFYANAMGMQGTFRPHRTDAGTYVDAQASDVNIETSVTERKGGSMSPLGYEKEEGNGNAMSFTVSTQFVKPNGTGVLEFTNAVDPVTGFDEAVYFKGVGENTPTDKTLYASLGGFSPARAAISKVHEDIILSQTVVPNSGPNYSLPLNGKTNWAKPVTAIYFKPRTVSELMSSHMNYDTYYENYAAGPNPLVTKVSRDSHQGNIISKVEVTGDDGTFYGYGLPNFSNSSSQVMFNIGSNSGNPSIIRDGQGLVSYSAGDNSVENTKGLSHYYDKTTVPAYAESFLLTDMHSSDYVDRTADGPSPDDIGNYYKFNYRRLHENFHWRFPRGEQKAFYIEGTWGSELDDIATYNAGSREVWVTHSVESKNYIAEFVLETAPREDGYGIDENGYKLSDEKTYALKRIELYSRSERQLNSSAKPIQVVEFTYNYELCQNYPQNNNADPAQRGKLTLKKLTVYSGKSYEQQQSSYQFDYGSGAVDNPNFNYGHIDVWGQYKPGDPVYNSRFPYVEQTGPLADKRPNEWKLKRVISPNGGLMEVTYESDRYAYVQDKRVMKHLAFEGLTNLFDLFTMLGLNQMNPAMIRQVMCMPAALISPYAAAVVELNNLKYCMENGQFNRMAVPNNVLVFKLDQPIAIGSETDPNEQVKKAYFTEANGTVMKELYLKAHMRITDEDESRRELVPVCAAISDDISNAFNNTYPVDEAPAIGVLPPLNGEVHHTYGYVILSPYRARNPKEEDLENGADHLYDDMVDDEMINPIQKAAFDFFQRSLGDIVFQNTAFSSGDNDLDILTGEKVDISKAMRKLGFGSTLVAGYNTIRVYIPSNMKLGGNARVRSIEFSDNWQHISQEYTSNYKYNYIYDFQRGKSSGVASYESRTANDESPFYGWDSYYDVRVQFPDRFNYTPKPVMELLYPSGSIGYSKVAVQLAGFPEKGYSVSEFYTAKDYPTLTGQTLLIKHKVDKVKKNAGETYKSCGLSQGFSIETNDFHGKIKSQSIVKGLLELETNPGEILSETVYEYYKPGEKQKISDEKGIITEVELGMDYDIHADSRVIENKTFSFYRGVKKLWTPIPLPSFTSNSSYARGGFYSHALIKHANRSAILKKVATRYMGSSTSAENMVFDRYSGAVILSSSQNEFSKEDEQNPGDKIYSLSYPAHWYYSEFRNVSASQDKRITLVLGSNSTITNPTVLKQLAPGDLLRFQNGDSAWVSKSYPWPDTPNYFLITRSGTEYAPGAGTYAVTVISSGRSNQVNAVMQQVETKTNPLGTSQILFPNAGILSANAITFRDKLNALCGKPEPGLPNNNVVSTGAVNPYLYGLRGDLVADNQLVWQSGRVQSTANGVRKDGAYNSFIPYYVMGTGGEWYQFSDSFHPHYPWYNVAATNRWRKSGETTVFNQYGNAVETKDPLKINSAQLFAYNAKYQLLPVAFAANAHKQDIAFEGFEDQEYYTGKLMANYEPHFEFIAVNSKQAFSSIHRHSGLYAAELIPGMKLTATKALKPFRDAKTEHQDVLNNTTQVDSCDCVPVFSPTPGEYVVSAWVKQSTHTDGSIQVILHDKSPVPVQLLDTSFTTTATALDGWQRIEGTLTIPANAGRITVSLVNQSGENVYFDDFRMHPFLAGMETVVYDPKTLQKIASHDGYNFTTFYNYDENNQLVRVRVETTEGIKTVSESEMSIYKQP